MAVLNRSLAALRPRMFVVSLPAIPRTFHARALNSDVTYPFVSAENSHPLIVGKKPLIVFELKRGVSFEVSPQEVVMAPLNAVFAVRAMARRLLIPNDFGVALVDRQSTLLPTIRFEIDKPLS